MKFEDLVPSLELCKKIPAGEFVDSALYWASQYGGTQPDVFPSECGNCDKFRIIAEDDAICPAPTLEEIMAAMPFCRVYKKVNGVFIAVHEKTRIAHMNAADAALKLWLKMKGIEDGE